MQLVEKHLIRKTDPRCALIDRAAFASKNLYNAALYEIRQHFIFCGKYLSYNQMDKLMRDHEAYRMLPSKVSQQVLKLLDKNWASYFEATKAYEEDPSKFLGRPKIPGYKDKQGGRNVLVYTIQAISKKSLKVGIIKPSQLGIEVRTGHTNVDQVRIVPKACGDYVVEVVYTQEEDVSTLDPKLVAAIDPGLNNLIALTANKVGFVPRLVNGRPIKSVNQGYDRVAGKIQKHFSTNHHTSRELSQVAAKRTRRIDAFLHTTSRRVIDLLIKEGIGTLVIGKNAGWKQEANMGKKNNQKFVQIPHARLIDMLCYKAKLVGIQVILQEESYTSKASFLDLDPLPVHGNVENKPVFSGKRIKRGMYRSGTGRQINADINGSYNIMRKALPNVFQGNGIGDAKTARTPFVVHPVRIVVPLRTQKSRIR